MSVRKYLPEEYVALAESHPDWSNVDIAESMGVDEATVRRNLSKSGFKRYLVPANHISRFANNLDTPLRLEGDWAITADWHVPLYNPQLVNQFILDCRERGIRNLLIAGDFLNGDQLSQYWPKQEDAGLDKEMSEAIALMHVLAQSFDRIVYIWGNHDYRYVKARNYKISFVDAMKGVFQRGGQELLEKIEFSNLDHCWVGDFYVCHPQSYNKHPLTTARALAAKTHSNVITAHAHHCAVGYDVSGEYVVAEAGGFFDKNRTQYLQRSTTFSEWTPGYILLLGGKVKVVSDAWTT